MCEKPFTSSHSFTTSSYTKLKLIKFVRLPMYNVVECFNPYGAIGLCVIGVCAVGIIPMGLGNTFAEKQTFSSSSVQCS